MIIDYTGIRGINYFGRVYDRVLGHIIKRSIWGAFKCFVENDVWYNFILGKTYHKDSKGNLTIARYCPFYRRIKFSLNI